MPSQPPTLTPAAARLLLRMIIKALRQRGTYEPDAHPNEHLTGTNDRTDTRRAA